MNKAEGLQQLDACKPSVFHMYSNAVYFLLSAIYKPNIISTKGNIRLKLNHETNIERNAMSETPPSIPTGIKSAGSLPLKR